MEEVPHFTTRLVDGDKNHLAAFTELAELIDKGER
jgi:hypothetical protein